ncbi:MAG: hypothetical protein NT172_05655 [Planctomycetota bacterium]|nr:hypothetical protein [Planctomycetota bacterium]
MTSISRRILLSGTVAGIFTGRSSARADLLRPNSKRVSHKIHFDNIQEYQNEYKFFFYPLNETAGPLWKEQQGELNKTGIVQVSGIRRKRPPMTNSGFFLLAVPRNQLDTQGLVDIKVLENPPAGVLKSEQLVSQIQAVDQSDKDEFLTIYHLRIMDGKLQAALIRHDEPRKREELKTTETGQKAFATVSAAIAFGALSLRFRNRKS